jgi:hypothetical protein
MADVAELVSLIEPLARQFFGEPNRARSSKTELRFGSHGSLSVDLDKGTWYDHEAQEGGGVVDLVRRQKGFHSDGECLQWLESDGYISDNRARPRGNGQYKLKPQHQQQPLGQEVAHYDYLDESGHLLFQVVRFEPKDFRQRVPDDSAPSGWRYSVKGVRQVPYRLPELIEASEHVIFIVEGEKDVDRFWREGGPATTNAGGAGKWRSELNKYFVDADVVIIADNDPQAKNKAGELLVHPDGRPRYAGFDHAHQVAAELSEVAARVRVFDLGVHWRDCPAKGDSSDWFEAGRTLEQLYELVESLPDWEESQAKRELPQPEITRRYATLYVPPNPMEIPRRGWLYGGHYIRQAATATVAPGGFGKTTLTIHEAIMMVAAGLAVWYLSGEDPKVEIDRRIAAHCLHHQVDLKTFTGRLFVDDKTSFPLSIATAPRSGVVKFDDRSLMEFEHAILASEIDVVMLDPFIAFHTVAENDNGSIDAVTKRLAAIAQRTDSCVEISHHVRKPFQGQGTLTVDDARGGSALINAVRSGRVINRMTQGEAENAKVSNEERHFYIRVDRGKRNMAPPDKASWFHLVSKEIANGDSVQALEEWEFPKAAKPTEADIIWLRMVMKGRPLGCNRNSADWIGEQLAEHFERDLDDDSDVKWIKQTIAHLIKEKVIRKVKLRIKDSKERNYYVLIEAKPNLTVVPRDGELPDDDDLEDDDSD